MKKKFLLTGIATVMIASLVLTGCGTRTTSDSENESKYQKINLSMAVNGTNTQIDARVADYFAELVEKNQMEM